MKFLSMLILLTISTHALSQNKVVVIPLGSDVSAKQFNDLVTQVNQQKVFTGVVLSNGAAQGSGGFTSSRISPGLYRIRLIPPVITYDYGDPSIVVTSRDVHLVPMVTVSKELIDNQILYVDFDVALRTTNGILQDAKFSFYFKFAEPD